jgi:NAD-dependent DNA ligase
VSLASGPGATKQQLDAVRGPSRRCSPEVLGVLRPTVNDIPEDGLLYGKTVVFTGSLSHFVRVEAAQLGGTGTSRV